jgi:DNA polymerase I-like protein with 3'-5' exonuclease and polymerase domains
MISLSKDKNGFYRVPEDYCPSIQLPKGGQDIYLWVGSQLPVIGPIIQASGYDPKNPTPEGIAAAKKQCKKERGIAKVVVLSSGYGAGAKKIFQTLVLSGVDITLNQCKQIHSGYWELFKGIKVWEKELRRQWIDNGGWVLNGIGRPLAICEDREKDLVNSVCQSTGHDCTILWIVILSELMDEAGLDWQPWLIDFHDEGIVAVKEGQEEQALNILTVLAPKRMNEILGGIIPLKLAGTIADNLADIKLED